MNSIVIPATDSGDSGRGTSYWLSFLGCAQRYVFDKETGESGEAARVGALFHKLLELYYQGQLENVTLEYSQGPLDPDWTEALRLFAFYRTIYPPDEWGVVACETPLRSTDESLFGVDEFTGRADMIIDVRPEHVQRVWDTRQLGLEPGLYLVDTKTKKQTSQ
ncbi:MAG: hypothetical protein ACREP9_15780, partial [Candidatus Dormibacteraceae bacterium]